MSKPSREAAVPPEVSEVTDRQILQAIQRLLDTGGTVDEVARLLVACGYPVKGYHLAYHFERKVQ